MIHYDSTHRGETHDGSSDQEAHAGSTGRIDAEAPRGGKEGGGNAQATGERSQSSSDTGKEQSLKVTPLVADDRGVPDHHQVLNVVHTCGDMLACVEDERHIGVVALVANGLVT